MKKIFFALLFMVMGLILNAQYEFKTEHQIGCSSVKSQDNTGTCWSFSTVSFLESEVLRLTGKSIDLSEMSIVHTIYLDKARNYILRQGKAQFSEGGLSHDVINAIRLNGVEPESVFPGNKDANGRYNHSEMVEELKTLITDFTKQKRLEENWMQPVRAMVDKGVGTLPGKFMYEGKGYTAKSFSEALHIVPDDYITITSFSHHPFYSKFILEIPDNYSNGTYYNVPLDELYNITKSAVEKGFSVAWDADVSEKGFNARQGLAILPYNGDYSEAFEGPVYEKQVTQKMRQAAYETYATTDDHLMHIVGTASDQLNKPYFIVKNSWGEIGPYKGEIYTSKSYFDMKTIAIMVHKDALPEEFKKRFGL